MTNLTANKHRLLGLFFVLFVSVAYGAHPINEFYKQHKNDKDMEAKVVPPKVVSLFVDEDYPEAIDVLQSLTALKYLNFYGDKTQISNYAKNAIAAKGTYKSLLEDVDGNRKVAVFGEKKNGSVRKIIAVVETRTQFLLLIGKGKLTNKQIQHLPALSKEIQ
ncbi:DUF4252 domain-containing protein [Paracrocinitomix mangrovi]|uniref:DUF4252 domain-containing protein n=1 Tax=Paracrocinitomix mangrovi TaxID=2862509 RepID=UPI001C8E1E10|nr:DUF4252 domain-containing protein [Paracrocinitomix mangrovi]UKN01934.1 DUF4252 domain-containing protein [Paracrocinitomix mangrovi]